MVFCTGRHVQTSTSDLAVGLISLCQVQALTGTGLSGLPQILTLGLCDTNVSKVLLRSSLLMPLLHCTCIDRLMENPWK